MIEQRGKWDGRQIVSSFWLDESFRPHGKLLGIDYGYLWYGESYSANGKQIQSQLAMGHGGQFLVLFPDLQSVLVITAKDYNQSIDFYRLIQDFVLPICSKPGLRAMHGSLVMFSVVQLELECSDDAFYR